jgi:purine-cytosine permease-like protein
MRIFFSILSIAYIAGIFLLAGSSAVSDLSPFNPYSLLHIPLFGILTVLLILSLVPMKFNPMNPINPSNPMKPSNSSNPNNFRTRFLISGMIALIVAIADEIHQAYVPGRDASITDVLLDFVGIILVLFIVLYFYKKQKIRKADPLIP